MSINNLLWSIAAVALASNSHASLISVEIIAGANQHPDGMHDTWQVIAIFDDENDRLLGVGGQGILSIDFTTGGGELYNQALYSGLPFNDFPSAGGLGGELYDSYATTGATIFPANTQFTGDFADWDGNVIAGSSFSGLGGWFYIGDPPPVGFFDIIPDNETFDVVIAQFTIDKGVGFHLSGSIAWKDVGDENNTPFSVDNIPAPSAAALLGIVALTTTRRRRR
ncbi:MAG: hypothetical protein IH984_09890 [Planctomycetes bacterium]|nr:hypothetical protein [Planctomycetota bacterium]